MINIKEAWQRAKMLAKHKAGAASAKGIVGLLVIVLFSIELIPTLADSIGSAQNLTTSQTNILKLITTMVVLGLVVFAGKKMDLL